MRLVIALGGNALLKKGQKGLFEEHIENLSRIAPSIVKISLRNEVVITHGNAPQVGFIYYQQEISAGRAPFMPLHACVAMSQGLIGYMLQQSITQAAKTMGVHIEVVSLISRVLVEKDDPAFKTPTKPIGPYYRKKEALELLRKRRWAMKEVERGWRRVVPSPEPKQILELGTIANLLKKRRVVVAVGGGGIPVVVDDRLKGIDAVIDKDLASALLAIEIGADELAILTDVNGVYVNYGKTSQRLLREVSVNELEKYLGQGHFPPGSMGPKVKAAIIFTRRTGKRTIIGPLERLEEVISGEKGTVVLP